MDGYFLDCPRTLGLKAHTQRIARYHNWDRTKNLHRCQNFRYCNACRWDMFAVSTVRPKENFINRAAFMWICSLLRWFHFILIYDTFEPGYNDIGLCDTSCITSDVLWCQFISHCGPKLYIPRLEIRPFITTQNMQSLSWRFNLVRLCIHIFILRNRAPSTHDVVISC